MKFVKKLNWFDVFNILLMILFSLAIIYPFWELVVLSFSDMEHTTTLEAHLWPNGGWYPDSYKFVIENLNVATGYANTIFRTVVGTVLSMILSMMAAYPLSKKTLVFRNQVTAFFLIPMFFSGGMIPSFLLIKQIGLIDSRLVYILPGAVQIYSVLIVRNYLMSLDRALEEAAEIEGAGRIAILMKIYFPLAIPVLAVTGLWAAVGHWNAWFDAMIYIRSEEKYVLQLMMRRVYDMQQRMAADIEFSRLHSDQKLTGVTVRSAITCITIGPIIFVYPFIQKYFVKGIIVGSLKG